MSHLPSRTACGDSRSIFAEHAVDERAASIHADEGEVAQLLHEAPARPYAAPCVKRCRRQREVRYALHTVEVGRDGPLPAGLARRSRQPATPKWRRGHVPLWVTTRPQLASEGLSERRALTSEAGIHPLDSPDMRALWFEEQGLLRDQAVVASRVEDRVVTAGVLGEEDRRPRTDALESLGVAALRRDGLVGWPGTPPRVC